MIFDITTMSEIINKTLHTAATRGYVQMEHKLAIMYMYVYAIGSLLVYGVNFLRYSYKLFF